MRSYIEVKIGACNANSILQGAKYIQLFLKVWASRKDCGLYNIVERTSKCEKKSRKKSILFGLKCVDEIVIDLKQTV